MRQNKLQTWEVADPRTVSARKYCFDHDDPQDFVERCERRSNETVANIMITQIRQIDAMLAKVLQKIEHEFIKNGDIK